MLRGAEEDTFISFYSGWSYGEHFDTPIRSKNTWWYLTVSEVCGLQRWSRNWEWLGTFDHLFPEKKRTGLKSNSSLVYSLRAIFIFHGLM